MQKIKKILIYFLGFLILSAASGYTTFKLLNLTRLTVVPDLKGKSLKEAEELSLKNNLSFIVEEENYDPHVPEGYIISQDIEAGSVLKGSGEIKVIVSRGTMANLTPSLIGKTLLEAKDILSDNGLDVPNVITVHSDTIKENIVIAQAPLPQKPAGAITLIVSKGQFDVTYYCPSFEGLSREDALSLGSELGLEIRLKGNGPVVRDQKPLPGTMINAGSEVEIQL